MQGFEILLQRRLGALLQSGVGTEFLNRESLLGMTDSELFAKLDGIQDQQLKDILREVHQFVPHLRFSGTLASSDVESSAAWASIPLTIKPGLDTQVLFEGQTMSLREFVEQTPSLVPSRILTRELTKYTNKSIVIRESGIYGTRRLV
jgi:hypothetical protein